MVLIIHVNLVDLKEPETDNMHKINFFDLNLDFFYLYLLFYKKTNTPIYNFFFKLSFSF